MAASVTEVAMNGGTAPVYVVVVLLQGHTHGSLLISHRELLQISMYVDMDTSLVLG